MILFRTLFEAFMVFQSANGIEQNRNVQIGLAIILIILASAFWVRAKILAPDIGMVNGIYKNECCEDLIIRDGTIFYGDYRKEFELKNIKFGITGYVRSRFLKRSLEDFDGDTPLNFVEEREGRVVSIPVDGKFYEFRMATAVR
jgi:hypothetical protein